MHLKVVKHVPVSTAHIFEMRKNTRKPKLNLKRHISSTDRRKELTASKLWTSSADGNTPELVSVKHIELLNVSFFPQLLRFWLNFCLAVKNRQKNPPEFLLCCCGRSAVKPPQPPPPDLLSAGVRQVEAVRRRRSSAPARLSWEKKIFSDYDDLI